MLLCAYKSTNLRKKIQDNVQVGWLLQGLVKVYEYESEEKFHNAYESYNYAESYKLITNIYHILHELDKDKKEKSGEESPR